MTLIEERDLLLRKLAALSNAKVLENLYQAGLEQEREITNLTKERDALAAAAKLALDALSKHGSPYLGHIAEYQQAEEALRRAGVQ